MPDTWRFKKSGSQSAAQTDWGLARYAACPVRLGSGVGIALGL